MEYAEKPALFPVYILATCLVFACGANKLRVRVVIFIFIYFFFNFLFPQTIFRFPLSPLFHLCPVIRLSLESVACRRFVSCKAEVIILWSSENVACLVTLF